METVNYGRNKFYDTGPRILEGAPLLSAMTLLTNTTTSSKALLTKKNIVIA